jgi:hypothetical protein
MNKTFDERLTVEAYKDEGNIVQGRHAQELSAAVENSKRAGGGVPESRLHHTAAVDLHLNRRPRSQVIHDLNTVSYCT